MKKICFMALLLFASVVVHAVDLPKQKQVVFKELTLENGEKMHNVTLGYRVLGVLNKERSNAILLTTWFGGTSADILNSGVLSGIDTEEFYIIVVDALGNGVSASPSNYSNFPAIAIGDMVRAQYQLLTDMLNIHHLHGVMGISMGGMQTFEWITQFPDFMDRAVPIVGSPQLAAYDVLLWQTQLDIIRSARASGRVKTATPLVAMVSALALYTPQYHAQRTPRSKAHAMISAVQADAGFAIENREAQLQAMLAHDVARHFDGSMEKAAAAVQAQVLNIVAIQDQMVTPTPAINFAALLGAETLAVETNCGHMAPVCEGEQIFGAMHAFFGKK